MDRLDAVAVEIDDRSTEIARFLIAQLRLSVDFGPGFQRADEE